MHDTKRILDANANRAREALRVMEEAARFVLNDAQLAAALKKLRHDLAAALKAVPGIELCRDTPGDVGTTITTPSEKQRGGVYDIVTASGKRLGEALRAIEEYGKAIDPDFAAKVEKLRYRAYDIESKLHARLGSPRRRQFKLCVLITESLCTHHGWFDVAKAALDGGADCLQLREKDLSDAELLDRARQLVESAMPQAAVIINDRPDIALTAVADGVHLGTKDLPIDAVRRIVGPGFIIGTSTHNLREAGAAIKAGADYCGVGAMFLTATRQRKPSGIAYLEKFLAKYPRTPHLAIGGITPDNAPQLIAAGAQGLAVSSCVCAAKKPATVVRKLLRAMR